MWPRSHNDGVIIGGRAWICHIYSVYKYIYTIRSRERLLPRYFIVIGRHETHPYDSIRTVCTAMHRKGIIMSLRSSSNYYVAGGHAYGIRYNLINIIIHRMMIEPDDDRPDDD